MIISNTALVHCAHVFRYLCQISVMNLQTNEENHFICDDWLTAEFPDSVHKHIPVAEDVNDFPFPYRYAFVTYKMMI